MSLLLPELEQHLREAIRSRAAANPAWAAGDGPRCNGASAHVAKELPTLVADSAQRASRPRLGRRVDAGVKALPLVASIVVVAAVAGLALIAIGHRQPSLKAGTRPTGHRQRSLAPRLPIDSVLVRHFGILRHSRGVDFRPLPPRDRLGWGWGVDLAMVRMAQPAPGVRMWLVPTGHAGVCMVMQMATLGSGGCGTISPDNPLNVTLDSDSSGQQLGGFVPDGNPTVTATLANRAKITARVVDNAFFMRAPSSNGFVDLLIRNFSGQLQVVPFPPGAEQRQVAHHESAELQQATKHLPAVVPNGSEQALFTKLRQLRGRPVVITSWASWCSPCLAQFGLIADAATRYQRAVAFLGADIKDSPEAASAFLRHHPVSYPTYNVTIAGLSSLTPIEGVPATIFINPAGKMVYVHSGEYESRASLDADIERFALHG